MKTTKTEIVNRWHTPSGIELAREVIQRLGAARSFDGLKLDEYDHRFDLRGLCLPTVKGERLSIPNWSVAKLQGQVTIRNMHLRDLDFSYSQLGHLHIFNSGITNCRFDQADCKQWKLWNTAATDSTWIGANLRQAGLGPWYQGQGNIFRRVDFSYADMRGLISPAATYIDCNFSFAKLEKIEFQSSSFIRCLFAGDIREVIFYDHGFQTGKPDPNPMEDVDFTKANLRWVEFRRLNLDRVRLPDDDNHIIVKHYRCVLERALSEVKGMESAPARAAGAILKHRLKWIGPSQGIGVFNRLDFREISGDAGEKFMIELLHGSEQECARIQ